MGRHGGLAAGETRHGAGRGEHPRQRRQRHTVRGQTAPVDAGRGVGQVEPGEAAHEGAELSLQRVTGAGIPRQRPAAHRTDGEHPRVLARAIVGEPARPEPGREQGVRRLRVHGKLRPAAERVLTDPGTCQQSLDDDHMDGFPSMGGAGQSDLLVRDAEGIGCIADEWQCLDRLGATPHCGAV